MDIAAVANNKWVHLGAATGVSLAVGFGGGYFVAKKKHQAEFESLTEAVMADMVAAGVFDEDVENGEGDAEPMVLTSEEFDEIRQRQTTEDGKNPVEMTDDDVEAFHARLREEEARRDAAQAEMIPDEHVQDERSNIFRPDGYVDRWNQEEENEKREGQSIYPISREEFFEEVDERGFSQITLMYYEGDNVMTMADDSVMNNPERKVGEPQFGHGSSDPSVVYVRNEDLNMEYEIILNRTSFEVEIGGLEIQDDYESQDLKRPLPRFRRE